MALPRSRPYQLAKLVDSVPPGDDWLFEMKFDGYRCQAAVSGSDAKLYSRSGADWTKQFGRLVPTLQSLTTGTALIDGEVCAIDEKGRADFQLLQRELKRGGPIVLYAFDLLELDGVDLRALPLIERKERLEELLGARDPLDPIQYSSHIVGHGQDVFEAMCTGGHEGVIAKRSRASYTAGDQSGTWLKVKCTKRQDFIVVGWMTDEQGRDLRSLIVAEPTDEGLIYRGRVGSGLTDKLRGGLLDVLQMIELESPPIAGVPKAIARRTRWTQPKVEVEVAFTELTRDGTLRHPSFKGVRV